MKHILITGASSGLGTALALEYAAPGITLFLGGRDLLRLERVAEECRAKGAVARPHVVNVTDDKAMDSWISPLSLDLVIANAGVSGGTANGPEEAAETREQFLTNIQGVANTCRPAISGMQRRQQGQIGIVSSLAGFRGFPGAPAYCASKAAARVYGEALRGLHAADGIGVSVICPGYIKTPMTDVNSFKMPLLMPAGKAAKIIKEGLAANRARIAFPKRLYALVWLLAFLPAAWVDGLLARLPRKQGLSPAPS